MKYYISSDFSFEIMSEIEEECGMDYIEIYAQYEDDKFKGGNKCTFPIQEIEKLIFFIDSFDLKKLSKSIKYEFILRDVYSNSILKFKKVDKFGHFDFNGRLGEYCDTNLYFITCLDQYELTKVSEFFKKCFNPYYKKKN